MCAVKALVQLCSSNDEDTLRFTLQTLELLAIENADLVCAQVSCVDRFTYLLIYLLTYLSRGQSGNHLSPNDTLLVFAVICSGLDRSQLCSTIDSLLKGMWT